MPWNGTINAHIGIPLSTKHTIVLSLVYPSAILIKNLFQFPHFQHFKNQVVLHMAIIGKPSSVTKHNANNRRKILRWPMTTRTTVIHHRKRREVETKKIRYKIKSDYLFIHSLHECEAEQVAMYSIMYTARQSIFHFTSIKQSFRQTYE